jgi:DNA repair exonuclease SbcCD nuclease subunit
MERFSSKKIGVFSDIHIGYGQDSSLWLENILAFGKWASDYYKKAGITEIAIPGDIFHNRDSISVKTLDVAKQFFDLFTDFDLVISTGNHDCYRKLDSEIHSLAFLKGWGNVEIVDTEPKVFKTPKGRTVSFIPWATKLEDIPKADIMFAHLDIKSFYMNGYTLCEHGYESDDLFQKSKFIVSGHFHRKDFREYTDGKILYLGSPHQMNFGEVNDVRGIYTFDLETEKFEFIENAISAKHKKIKVSDILTKKVGITELKADIPNNLICLVIDEALSPDTHSVLVSKIQNLGPKLLKFEYKEPKIDISVDGEIEFTATDISKILEDYIGAMDAKNKEEIKSYLLEIYQELK